MIPFLISREENVQSGSLTNSSSFFSQRCVNRLRSTMSCLFVLLIFNASANSQESQNTPTRSATPTLLNNSQVGFSFQASYRPMTGSERWRDYWHTNFASPGAFFQTFFSAVGDSAGGVPNWDSGALGFSEHLGSQFARFTIGGTVHSSLAAAFQQDTRYFPCPCTGGLHRTAHALGRTLVTYDKHGHRQVDFSGLAGIYAGPTTMMAWYPSKYTPLGYGIRQGNISLGITAAINVFDEFSPEIKRSFRFTRTAD